MIFNKKIPYGRQEITDEDIIAVVETLKSDYLTQGPKIQEFENAFSNYVGSKYAVAVSNATAALHLSTLALNISEGDKVITSPITFVASANCIRYSKGEVVFSDIDPETLLLDIDKVRLLLTNNPDQKFKGIVLVNFAGRSNNLEEFKKLANEFNLWIIEDACHSPGGHFIDSKGNKCRSGSGISDLAIFSFHPVKHIATGEGGMITTNNHELYLKLLELRSHGITKQKDLLEQNHGGWYYEMYMLGYNYRLTDIQAALGISQLKRARLGLEKRRQIVKYYCKNLNNNIIIRSKRIEGHAYHLFIIEVNKRKEFYDYLHKNNILVQIHYIPVHLMPYYKKLGNKIGDMPNAEKYYDKCISLPIFPSLTTEELDYIIFTINNFKF